MAFPGCGIGHFGGSLSVVRGARGRPVAKSIWKGPTICSVAWTVPV
jgi:hypothetical protein